MKERARELEREADQHRSAGRISEAGDAYTSAAHEYAGSAERTFPEPGDTQFVLGALLKAATCYRISGDDFRTQNRCDLGTTIAEDHIEYVDRQDIEPGTFADLRRGAWPEFIGDLRTVASRTDADEAYDRAISIYESAGDFESVYAEQEHTKLAAFFRIVRSGVGQTIAEDDPEQLGFGTTFTEWVEYKRKRLPGLLDELEEQGEWPL